jgi:hypothetical protein
MTTDTKLYVAIGVLVVLGGTLYIVNKQKKEEAATYTIEGRTADLPKIEITEDKAKSVDKISIEQPAGDAGKAEKVVLQKKGEEWKLSEPIEAKANDSNVKSLIDNLKSLKVIELINPSKDAYAKYDLADDKAVHATFFKGNDKIAEFFFGESGTRGQMTRLPGKDGVYAVKGYSSFLYARDLKGWRDLTVFKFEDKNVKTVQIENEHGNYSFEKSGEDWTAKHKKPKGPAPQKIERFDKAKVEDMIRAFKALNADGYADKGKTAADLGLDKPAATVVFTLDDGARRQLQVGATAEGTSRWAKTNDSDTLFSISSWSADWAMAKPDKFQKPDEKKDGGKDEAKIEPPGMPGMPGMHGIDEGAGFHE